MRKLLLIFTQTVEKQEKKIILMWIVLDNKKKPKNVFKSEISI